MANESSESGRDLVGIVESCATKHDIIHPTMSPDLNTRGSDGLKRRRAAMDVGYFASVGWPNSL